MKKKLLAGLATVLFLLTSTGIAMAGDDAKNKIDSNNSKTTGLYDNVTILQEQINSLTERIGRLEGLYELGDRFTDMGDGTIQDNDSGLIWLKDANCVDLSLTDKYGKACWLLAKMAALALADGTCGLDDGSAAGDWRLPTRAEWKAFMSTVYENPALVNTVGDAQWSEGDAFTGVQSLYYWSSTEYDSGRAWFANMHYGHMGYYYKGSDNYVWPVRSVINRFTDMGDGTIQDYDSGLIWLKDANCFGTKNWGDATDAAAALVGDGSQCGLTDGSQAGQWRLPTKDEWEAFYSSHYENPALVNTVGDAKWSEGDAFNGVQSRPYWSKTWASSGIRFVADLEKGNIFIEYEDPPVIPTYVWPVRQ